MNEYSSRIGRRGRKAARIAAAGEPTRAREELEHRWLTRRNDEPRLAVMVTGEGARREPFHRWMAYRQGFSPALVRLFLAENAARGQSWRGQVVLDPFSGSGTTVVECARNGVCGMGIEALPSLVFLTAMKWARGFPPFPEVLESVRWQEVADRLTEPIHRAALMLAVGRQYTREGRLNRGAAPLGRLIQESAATLRDDLVHPLTTRGLVIHGDARRMGMLADNGIGGILTSPPYLSRYDYREAVSPYEQVHTHWYGAKSAGAISSQLQASPTTTSARSGDEAVHSAAEEACARLMQTGHRQVAKMVRRYISDMGTLLRECFRVLAPGGVCWMVIGGARLKDVYIPADLIIAELAMAIGFRIDAVRVSRDLIAARRRFGGVGHLSPRESVVVMARE